MGKHVLNNKNVGEKIKIQKKKNPAIFTVWQKKKKMVLVDEKGRQHRRVMFQM